MRSVTHAVMRAVMHAMARVGARGGCLSQAPPSPWPPTPCNLHDWFRARLLHTVRAAAIAILGGGEPRRPNMSGERGGLWAVAAADGPAVRRRALPPVRTTPSSDRRHVATGPPRRHVATGPPRRGDRAAQTEPSAEGLHLLSLLLSRRLNPFYGTGVLVFVLHFLYMDKSDEFQLVQFILKFKTSQFLTSGVFSLAIIGTETFFCLQERAVR